MIKKLLEINGISKTYPGVIANSDISFNINTGEVHALLGENGAGKSTLVKIIYGLVKPDSGNLLLNGVPFRPGTPSEARKAGIAMVFQHFSLFEALSVAENISLGMDNPPNQRDLGKKIKSVSESYGLPLDPAKTVGELSVGERQRVEIIRCLLQNPKLLVMDEPTSVLTPQEVDILFKTLLKLRSEGTSILYISHKLEEIRKLCDTATILRLGKKVDTCTPEKTSTKKLAEMMVGSTIKAPEKLNEPAGRVMLNVNKICCVSKSQFGTSLTNVTFDLRQGEILGIGGVAGNGQDELFAVLSGEQFSQYGSISLSGINITKFNPNQRRKIGLLSAPEERLGHAAAPNMSLIENTLITAENSQNLVSRGFIDWKKSKVFAEKVIKKFDVRTPSSQNTAGSLSGGNLQKFVVGREIIKKPKVFFVAQPTWGVDIGATKFIRNALIDLANDGCGIIVISQDLEELFELADNICVLFRGKFSESKPLQELNSEKIGMLMGGEDLYSESQGH